MFVRSWSLKPRSWWRTFLEDPYGSMFVGEREIPIRTIQTRSERLKDLVSQAYKEKYNTPGICSIRERDVPPEVTRDNDRTGSAVAEINRIRSLLFCCIIYCMDEKLANPIMSKV